jgi:hypothetical protein
MANTTTAVFLNRPRRFGKTLLVMPHHLAVAPERGGRSVWSDTHTEAVRGLGMRYIICDRYYLTTILDALSRDNNSSHLLWLFTSNRLLYARQYFAFIKPRPI